MRRRIFFFLFAIIAFKLQAAQEFLVSGIAKNTAGVAVPNQLIAVRTSIGYFGTPSSIYYSELQYVRTDSLGVFTVEVGRGTLIQGNFNTINWSTFGTVLLEIDLNGGSNFVLSNQIYVIPTLFSKYSYLGGATGPQGLPGEDGKGVFTSTGFPANSIGVDSSFCIDTLNLILYGPKMNGRWQPIGIRIKGKKGPTGFTGASGQMGSVTATYLSDTINPTSQSGSNGDYFINTKSGQLFGPKTSSGWGLGILLKSNLKGNPGLQGPIGNSGFNHFIGERFGGGTIFKLWRDTLGVEHGLILGDTVYNLMVSTVVGNVSQLRINSSVDGKQNTVGLRGLNLSQSTMIGRALAYNGGGYSDWYIPSIWEVREIYRQSLEVIRTRERLHLEPWLFGMSYGSHILSSTSIKPGDLCVFLNLTGVADLSLINPQYEVCITPIRSF